MLVFHPCLIVRMSVISFSPLLTQSSPGEMGDVSGGRPGSDDDPID